MLLHVNFGTHYYSILFVLFYFFTTSLMAHQCNILDVTRFGHEQYQHIVINGTIQKNMPPTNKQQPEKRYEIIKKFLKLYKRPFTMLDIGAAQGYHSLRAAWDFPDSVFVMIEGNNDSYKLAGDQLLSICRCNDRLRNIIHLNKQVVVSDLVHLAECEHFDVILMLNILHWLGVQWKDALNAAIRSGDNIIIETPPGQESPKAQQIIDYLHEIKAQEIGQVPRHTAKNRKSSLFLISSSGQKKLIRSTWIRKDAKQNELISNFEQKKLKKSDGRKVVITSWIPGINLITFKMYNGQYPSQEILKSELYRWKHENHTDWAPNNFIIQGSKLTMIDYDNNKEFRPRTYQRFGNMLKFIESQDPQEIEKLFWKSVRSLR